MGAKIKELLERAKGHVMTVEEREKQRRSFAYGNTKIENERISRRSINQQAERLQSEHAPSDRA